MESHPLATAGVVGFEIGPRRGLFAGSGNNFPGAGKMMAECGGAVAMIPTVWITATGPVIVSVAPLAAWGWPVGDGVRLPYPNRSPARVGLTGVRLPYPIV